MVFLSSKFKSPATVSNYISGAASWVTMSGGKRDNFADKFVKDTRQGIVKMSDHKTRRAPPITPEDIVTIVDYLWDTGPSGDVLIAAFLIGYFTLIRQSNLLSPNLDLWGGPHTIRRGDIVPVHGGLCLTIRSSKTIRKTQDTAPILIPRIQGSRYCPVAAWERNERAILLSSTDPAFVSPHGALVTPYLLTQVLRVALKGSAHKDPSLLTLHGMRRGAAQAAIRAGATLQQVMALGTWLSSSVFNYVPKPMITKASIALSKLFGCRPISATKTPN